MATVGEFIAQQLESAGIDITTDEVKPLLGITVAMPEGYTDKVRSALMPIDAAKSNKDVKNHILNQFIRGVDQSINSKLEGLGLSKEQIDEIYKSEEGKNLTGRMELMLEKIDNIHKEAAKASGKKPSEEIEAFKRNEQALRDEIQKIKNDWANETQTLRSTFENEKINDAKAREFLGKKWSENYPENIRMDLANIALNKKLEEAGAKVVLDGGKLKLVPVDNPEADYFDKSNKKVSFTEFTDALMSENKFTAVTPPGGQNAANPTVVAIPAQSAKVTPQSKALEQSKRDMGMV